MEEEASIAATVRSTKSQKGCPKTYAQAKRSAGASEWQKAMQKQMETLTSNDTWQEVDIGSLPARNKVLSGKWVYTEKEKKNGEKMKKARWVVRGFEQQDEDIDWNDLTTATVRAQTTRILFAMAAEKNWEIQQMDAVAAFLNGDIKENVYVEISMGWRQKGKICKLKKTLYGLKTSSAIWYGLQTSFLQSIGFV